MFKGKGSECAPTLVQGIWPMHLHHQQQTTSSTFPHGVSLPSSVFQPHAELHLPRKTRRTRRHRGCFS